MPDFDFDTVIDRRHSDSVKWNYPEDILPMWVADTDFMAPPAVIEALQRRVAHGVFGYHYESPTLRQAVVQWVAERYGWAIEPEWLIFPPDVMVGMNWAAQTVAAPGDGILLQTPVYGPFFDLVRNGDFVMQDAPLVQDADGRWGLDMAALEEAADARTRAFLLCNPQNPTGRVFTPSELEALAEFCLERDIMKSTRIWFTANPDTHPLPRWTPPSPPEPSLSSPPARRLTLRGSRPRWASFPTPNCVNAWSRRPEGS